MQLSDRDRAGGVDVTGETGETRELVIAPHAELAGETLANGLHVRSAGHCQPEAAVGSKRQPAVLVVREGSVVVALLIGQRSEHEVIWQGSTPGQ